MNIGDFIDDCSDKKLDGSILTFIDEFKDPKWSFAKIDENNLITEVKEKVVISKYATVGIYLYSKGKDFVNATIDMIIENERVNGEFYTCPTYNYSIKENAKIGIYNIDFKQMHGIGTPDDLNLYLDSNC
jgi:dTDP-glucose pyrophosphorylase